MSSVETLQTHFGRSLESFRHVPTGIVVFTIRGEVALVNEAAVAIASQPNSPSHPALDVPTNLSLVPFQDEPSPFFRRMLQSANADILTNEKTILLPIVDQIGLRRVIEARLSWVRREDGARLGLMAAFNDVTKREEERSAMRALTDMAPLLEGSRNIDSIITAIVAEINHIVPHDSGTFMLLEKNNGRVAGASLRHSWDFRLDSGQAPTEPLSDKIRNTLQLIATSGQITIFEDTQLKRDEWDPNGREWIKSYMGGPIKVDGKIVAVINLNYSIPNYFSEDHKKRFDLLLNLLNATLQRYHESHLDLLTGLPDEFQFNEILARELKRVKRSNGILSVVYLDADWFKEINDLFGHNAGDDYLQRLAELMRMLQRETDYSFRLHGEEFAFVLTDTDAIGAIRQALRILRKVEELAAKFHLDCQKNVPSPVKSTGFKSGTVSIGIGTYPRDGGSVDELKSMADTAMYKSKQRKNALTYIGIPHMVVSTEQEAKTLIALLLSQSSGSEHSKAPS